MEPVASAESMVQGGYSSQWFHDFKRSLDVIEDIVRCYMYFVDYEGAMQQRSQIMKIEKFPIENMTGISDTLFTLRVVNVNVPNHAHADGKNKPGTLSWTCPFGKYRGAQMVVRQLGRMFPYPAGSIFGVDGRNIVHYVTDWDGKDAERYVVGGYNYNKICMVD